MGLFDREDSGAEFSEDRVYRYTLWRIWDAALPQVAFIGLNPSTADETVNDPTIAGCIRRSKTNGYGGMWMLNLFAFRATDPKVMKAHPSPVGPDNDAKLLEVAHKVKTVVGCWGAHGDHTGLSKLPHSRSQQVIDLMNENGVMLWRYDAPLTKNAQPRHPLYLKNDLWLTRWCP